MVHRGQALEQLELIASQVPETYEWLEKECCRAIETKIPAEQMKEAKRLLQWELGQIKDRNLAVIFSHLHTYMKEMNLRAEDIKFSGGVLSSLVAYILGITCLNPVTYGFATESFYGDYKKGAFVPEVPYVALMVSPTVRQQSFPVLNNLPGIGEVAELGWESQYLIAFLPREKAPDVGPVYCKANGQLCTVFHQVAYEKCWVWEFSAWNVLEHLAMLYKMTGVNPADIPLEDEETVNYLREGEIYSCAQKYNPTLTDGSELHLEMLGLGFEESTPGEKKRKSKSIYKEMVEALNPTSFHDFAKIYGLLRGTGTWSDKIQEMVQAGELSKKNILASREDVREYLKTKGIPSEKVGGLPHHPRNSGALNSYLPETGVDDWFLKSCMEIGNLWARHSVMQNTLIFWRLAYFRTHYPKIFYDTLLVREDGVLPASR